MYNKLLKPGWKVRLKIQNSRMHNHLEQTCYLFSFRNVHPTPDSGTMARLIHALPRYLIIFVYHHTICSSCHQSMCFLSANMLLCLSIVGSDGCQRINSYYLSQCNWERCWQTRSPFGFKQHNQIIHIQNDTL